MIQGKPDLVEDLVNAALQSGQNANRILEELIAGVREVGDLFSSGEYFLPDLLLGAKAMKAGLTLLEPELTKQSDNSQIKKQRKVLLGTVKGDLHDIGKSLVGLMFEINGYDVKDLGVDVSTDQFIEEAKLYQPDVIGLSSLLTTTAMQMVEIIKALFEAGIRNESLVIVGGAATTSAFAEEIHADGWAENGIDAVKLAEVRLTEKR